MDVQQPRIVKSFNSRVSGNTLGCFDSKIIINSISYIATWMFKTQDWHKATCILKTEQYQRGSHSWMSFKLPRMSQGNQGKAQVLNTFSVLRILSLHLSATLRYVTGIFCMLALAIQLAVVPKAFESRRNLGQDG